MDSFHQCLDSLGHDFIGRPALKHLFLTPWTSVALALGFGLWGLNWGLPSRARADRVLRPEMRNEAFYQKIEAARTEFYEKLKGAPVAYQGRLQQGQTKPVLPTILSSYSSFLARTHHGDEQATLVALSYIKPWRGQFYPHMFLYGGLYLDALGGYLGFLHLVHLISLVPRASFYYAHPDAIARVYYAARFWSILGLIAGGLALFSLGRRFYSPEVGAWASVFYVLTPGSIGQAKMAKPHLWGAALTLWAIHLCLQAFEDRTLKSLLCAALLFGLAVATSMPQAFFLLFLVWAAWDNRWTRTMKRAAMAFGIVGITYLLPNLYILTHFKDYMDESYFVRHYSPFAVRWGAIWDFGGKMLLAMLGPALWILALAAVTFAIVQRRDKIMRMASAISLVIMVVVAFQVQLFHGVAVNIRGWLALPGFWCLTAVWMTFKVKGGRALRGICLAALLAGAVVYDLHFCSDRIPHDNAWLAADWIDAHVPAGSILAQPLAVPHVSAFPPLDFTRYRIISFDDSTFKESKGPIFAIIRQDDGTSRKELKKEGFTSVAVFAHSPLQRLGFQDPFADADFPIEIFQKG